MVNGALIPVMIRLVRAGLVETEIIRLFLRQLGQFDAQFFEMQRRDLFVEMLGKHVDFVM